MMVKLSRLPGVKVFKSYSELFKHMSSEMQKLHDSTHARVHKAPKPTTTQPKAVR
jgi:hypothetical protein